MTQARVCMWWAATLLWIAGIWYLSAQPDLRTTFEQDFLLRKIAHVLVFGGLAYLVAKTWVVSGWRHSIAATMLWSLAYAMIDEWHQSYVPGRHGALTDVAIDAIGIVLVALCVFKYQTSPVGTGDGKKRGVIPTSLRGTAPLSVIARSLRRSNLRDDGKD